jgi:putative MATE family efflux protein
MFHKPLGLAMTQHAIQRNKARKKELFTMTWPMLLGVFSLMSFQLADAAFIAQLGIEPLAVIGFTIPIYQVFIGVQVGIGIATTALISQRLGANQESEARRLGSVILLFGSLLIISIALLIWLIRAQILDLLGGEASLLPILSELWSVWLISAFFGAFAYFGYSISRAHGNTIIPGMAMVVTSLANIALDPLFIFYFDFGLVGAAYASVIAFSIGWFMVYPKILAESWLSFETLFGEVLEEISKVLKIAGPAVLSQLLPALSAIIATSAVAQFGTETVAAWGLGVRLEFFSVILVLALTMSLPPMIGKNFGAKNFEEIRQLIRLSLRFIFISQLGFAVLLALFAMPISHVLAGTEPVAAIFYWYIIFIPISYAPLGVCILLISASNAISKAKSALLMSFIRLFICYLPFVYLGAYLGGLKGLMLGAAIGNTIAGIIAWFIYERAFKQALEASLRTDT